MHGGQNTAAALEAAAADIDTVGADTATVNAEFWALVCADDEWLAAEFGAIVSEPCETRVRISFRPNRIDAAPPDGSGPALPGATSSFRDRVADRGTSRPTVAPRAVTPARGNALNSANTKPCKNIRPSRMDGDANPMTIRAWPRRRRLHRVTPLLRTTIGHRTRVS